MKGIFPLDSFQKLRTPFYYYDSKLLRETLNEIKREAGKHEGFTVHYAVKANANAMLDKLKKAGFNGFVVAGK